MNKILCSSGAIIGRANNNDYTLLKEYAPRLNCDGFELMMSSSWYPILDDVIETVSSYGLNIPVIHSHKSLGETLCGMTTTFSEGQFHDYVMTPDEDKEVYRQGTEKFLLNLKMAEKLGAGHIEFDSFLGKLGEYGYRGDFTVESTALAKDGTVDFDMLNRCFGKIRELKEHYIVKSGPL